MNTLYSKSLEGPDKVKLPSKHCAQVRGNSHDLSRNILNTHSGFHDGGMLKILEEQGNTSLIDMSHTTLTQHSTGKCLPLVLWVTGAVWGRAGNKASENHVLLCYNYIGGLESINFRTSSKINYLLGRRFITMRQVWVSSIPVVLTHNHASQSATACQGVVRQLILIL